MRRLLLLMMVLLASACSTASQKEVVDNPYSDRMRELSRTGADAMQRERWQVAERLFDRALQAAQLANDPDLIGQAWYNLGVLHAAAGDTEKSEQTLMRAASIAERNSQQVTLLRARIALALLHQREGRQAWQPEELGPSMPLDLHLSLARLAQLQERYEVSRKEYDYVLGKYGDDRDTLMYKINAHMGLALLLKELGDINAAETEIAEVLKMSRDIGAPRQAAHAHLLSAKLSKDEALKQENLQDALAIYEALDDRHGQRDALTLLIEISARQGDAAKADALRRKLEALEGSPAKSDDEGSAP